MEGSKVLHGVMFNPLEQLPILFGSKMVFVKLKFVSEVSREHIGIFYGFIFVYIHRGA